MTDMDVSPQGLWTDLKNQNILPVDGALMRSYEQELQDLVQNIDIMVKKRETDLKQQLRRVYKHLEKKNKEFQQQKLSFEENSKKIITLQAEVDQVTAEKDNLEEMHEREMAKLKSKATHLRTDHERLHKTFLRKMEKRSKSTDGKDEERKLLVQQLSEKLKECENRLKVVQEQKATLQKAFDSIDSECKTFQDKYENLETINERLVINLEECERLRQDGEQEIYRLQNLAKEQSDDLIDYGKSDDLLKRAVITLRTDLNTKMATITNLELELERCREDQANRIQVDQDLIETLQFENQHLHQDLMQNREDTKDYSNLREQLEVLKAERVVLMEKISDQTEKLKNHKTEMYSKINELKKGYEGMFKKDWMAHSRDADEAMVDIELQLKDGLKKSKEKEEYYQDKVGTLEHMKSVLHEQLVEEFRKQEDDKGEKEDYSDEEEKEVVVVAAVEEEEEEGDNKRVEDVHLLNKQVGDRVHQSTSTLNRPLNPTNQKNLQQVIDTIQIQPKRVENGFYVSQRQLKDFLHKEQIYRRHWEDNFSKELHNIWQNNEMVIQQYINNL